MMKKLTALTAFAISAAAAHAADVKPFVMLDASSEQDGATLANDYINANLTVGVKTQNKMEYSLKIGASEKTSSSGSESYSRNIEGKIKKSFDIGMPFIPYVSARLGQKTNNTGSVKSFAHWAVDAGLKLPLTEAFAVDVGVRYRDALDRAVPYQSTRYHVMGLYEFDPHNVVGLRYTTSTSNETTSEERKGWRLHYQRNY